MKSLVTGVAGFIGSQVAEALLKRGDEVIGIDCFTDYYGRSFKEANLAGLLGRRGFRLVEDDLTGMDLAGLLDGVSVVVHEAAQAGVRASWGASFEHYTQNNVLATQRLFEACLKAGVSKVVYASSSSVYGDCDDLPARENSVTRPLSPYGVTKVAVEHLGYLYWKNYGLHTVGMRYFTVYGPRQRPDMAFHRFIRAGLEGGGIRIFGDGLQSRDFTYVSDIVAATLAAADSGHAGGVYNVGGGARISIREVLEMLERLLETRLNVSYEGTVKGDVRHTAADISLAREHFGYEPRVRIEEGLLAEAAWLRTLIG